MDKRFKKAIHDSFSFPEAERKEEFFSQAEFAPEVEKESRSRKPVIFRITAAAAACAAAFGIWSGVRYMNVSRKPDLRGDSLITEISQPTEAGTATTAETVQTFQTTTAQVTTAIVTQTAESSVTALMTTAAVPVTTTFIRTEMPVTTALTTDLPPVTTTNITGLENELDEYERSKIMKKIASYTAALAMLGSAIPTGAAAEYIPPQPTEEQLAIYSTLDSGNVDLDFNSDGQFDINDVYKLYSAAHNFDITSKETKEYFNTHGDVNGDGETGYKDADALLSYFVYKNGVPAEAFHAENYKNDEGNVSAGSYMFVYDLMYEAEEYNILYGYIADKIDAGSYDIDVNSDGIVNGEDAFEYYIFNYSGSYMRITQGIEFPAENTILGKDIWEKCDALSKALAADDLCSYEGSTEQIAKYVFYKNGVTSDDLSVNAYRDILSTLPNSELVLREGDFRQTALGVDYTGMTVGYFYTKSADIFSAMVKEIAVESGMANIENRRDKAFMDFDDDYYEEKYAEYEAAIEAGEVPPPDFNKDLSCNDDDLDILRRYYEDICQMKDASESDIDSEAWNFIDREFDIDGNGISGDVYDVFMAETYIIENVNYNGNADELLKAYYEKQAEMQTKSLAKREITYLSGLGVSRTGDANEDGEVNMADAVKIMQAVTNPDKYQLSDWGEFNADIFDTGSGVTQMDACQLQRDLLNK